jgi:hypothetical protein
LRQPISQCPPQSLDLSNARKKKTAGFSQKQAKPVLNTSHSDAYARDGRPVSNLWTWLPIILSFKNDTTILSFTAEEKRQTNKCANQVLKEFSTIPLLTFGEQPHQLNVPDIEPTSDDIFSILGYNLELDKNYKALRPHFEQRTLFTTKRGYLGLSASGIAEGDRMCIVLGCDTSLIIRPVRYINSSYRALEPFLLVELWMVKRCIMLMPSKEV